MNFAFDWAFIELSTVQPLQRNSIYVSLQFVLILFIFWVLRGEYLKYLFWNIFIVNLLEILYSYSRTTDYLYEYKSFGTFNAMYIACPLNIRTDFV